MINKCEICNKRIDRADAFKIRTEEKVECRCCKEEVSNYVHVGCYFVKRFNELFEEEIKQLQS